MKINFYLLVIIMVLTAAGLDAKDNPELKGQYGIYGSLGILSHTADFNELPGLNSCCGEFGDGSGTGFSFGFLYKMPLSSSLGLDFRLGYSSLPGEITHEEYIGNAYNYDLQTVKAISEYKLESAFGMIEFTPTLSIQLFNKPIYFNLGASLGLILSGSYDYSEELIEPDNIMFIDGTDIHSSEGDIDKIASLYMAGIGSISYDIDISKTLVFSPELAFCYNFTNLVQDVSWKVNSIRLGFALKYHSGPPAPKPPAEAPVPDMPPPPPPVEEPELSGKILVYGVDENGKEEEVLRIKSQEFLSRRIHPLLNYVFFGENEAAISSRYASLSNTEINSFDEHSLDNRKTMDIYHNVLNIVAHRMKENPKAKLYINGYSSMDSIESANTRLALNRAESVRDYFAENWGIPKSRLIVKSGKLPPDPSNTTAIDGIEENRRVELSSNIADILGPVTARDTIIETTPPFLRFRINTGSDTEIKEWEVEISQGGKPLKKFSGKGKPTGTYDWDMAADKASVPRTDEGLEYVLKLTDQKGRKFKSETASIPVQAITTRDKYLALMDGKQISDKEYNVFSLMSFGFNKAELNKEHYEIIDIAKSKINDNSIVNVTGYSDRTGEEAHNLQLSSKRALATAVALGLGPETAKGVGEDNPNFDNNLPEGRFYNRSVYIIIENPVEGK